MPEIDDDNLDVLQNIEFGIMQVYRADDSLLDFDVKDALDALVRHYHAKEEERRPPFVKLGARAQRVFDAVQEVCEWRLEDTPSGGDEESGESGVPIGTLVSCLRKIQKSVVYWTKEGGRQGYLDYVSRFVG